MFKKVFLTLLAINFIFFSIFASTTKAAVPEPGRTWYYPNFSEFSDRVFGSDRNEIFGERYTFAQVVWIFHSLTALLIPHTILNCIVDPSPIQCFRDVLPLVDNSINTNNSLGGIINHLITNNPVSGVGYILEAMSKFNLVEEVHAQGGFGYTSLTSIRNIWILIRNVTYFILIILIIILAFMIMFRVKLSPQTTITIQSAIPRIVIAAILITFSYAISGLIIDLSYLILGFFSAAITSGSVSQRITNLETLEFFTRLFSFYPLVAMFYIPFIVIFVLQEAGLIATLIPFVGATIFFIDTFITLIVISIFIIIWLRIVWTMIKAFVNIVLLIIVSPIIIALGVFPGFGGFGTWLKNLASNVAVFVGIPIMFFIAHFLYWNTFNEGGVLGRFMSSSELLNPYGIVPHGLGSSIQLPGFSMSSDIVGLVASFGILFLVPNIANIIKSFISGRPFAYGTAIGQVLATGAGIAWTIPGTAWGWAKAGVEKAIIERISQTTLAERIASTFGKKKT